MKRETRTEKKFLWYCDSIIHNYHKEIIEEFQDSLFTDVSLTVGFTENLEFQVHIRVALDYLLKKQT